MLPVLSRVVADSDPKYWLESALLTDGKPDCVVPVWGERSSVIMELAASPAFTPPNWVPDQNLCPVNSVSTAPPQKDAVIHRQEMKRFMIFIVTRLFPAASACWEGFRRMRCCQPTVGDGWVDHVTHQSVAICGTILRSKTRSNLFKVSQHVCRNLCFRMPEDLIYVGMRAGVKGQFSGGLVHIGASFFTLFNGVNLHLQLNENISIG